MIATRVPLLEPFLSAAALGGFVLAGCGSSDTTTTAARPPANAAVTTTASNPPQLLGSYERYVTRADIKRTARIRREGPGQQRPSPGPARLVITRSEMTFVDPKAQPPFSIEEDISATADGHLRINGYVHPDKGSFCGPEVPQNGSYSWARRDGVLELKAVTDRCADRDSTLTGAWRRTR